MTPRNSIDGHEADIVPVTRVFRAGIAEANKESHDAASRALAYFFLSPPPAGAFAPPPRARAAPPAGAAVAAPAAGAAPGAGTPVAAAAAAAAAAFCSSA